MTDFSVEEYNEDDFVPPVEEKKPVVSDDVANQVAGEAIMLGSEPDPLAKFEEYKSSMLQQTVHPEIQQLIDTVKADHSNTVVDSASQLVAEGELTPEEALDRIEANLDNFQPNLGTALTETAAATAEPTTKEGKEVHDGWKENFLDDEIEQREELRELVTGLYDEFELSWGMVADGLGTFLPFVESAAFAEWINKSGIEHSPIKKVVPGELLVDMRNHVAGLEPQERIDFFHDMSSFLAENAGVLGGNEVIRLGMLIDTFSSAAGLEDPDDFDWERWVLDFGGIMDLTIIGAPLAKGLTRVFRAAKSNVLGRVSTANPQAGARLAELLAANRMEEAANETAETLRAKYVLPKDAEWKSASTPEVVRQAILDADDELEEVLGVIDRVEGFINKEAQVAAKSLEKTLSNAQGSRVWVADTSLERTGEGWKASALVAHSDESGWASLQAVKDANKNLFGGKGTIVERTIKDGELRSTGRTVNGKPVVSEAKPGTEYFLKVDHNRKIVFMDDDFGVVAGGGMHSFVFDPDSMFNKRITTKGNAVFDQYKLLEKTVERRFNFIAQLANDEKLVVSKLLSRGLQRERVYTPREITRLARASGVKDHKIPKLVEAYQEARRGFDTMYVMEERIFRTKLLADGYSSSVRVGDEVLDFARPIEDTTSVKRVYNPRTGEVEDFAGDETAQVVQLRSPVRIDGEQSRFVVLTDDVVQEELPMFALNYRQGWVPTMYKENYFITKTSKVKDNGSLVDAESVVAVAHTRNEALAQVSKLNDNAGEAGDVYAFKHDRFIGQEESVKLQADLYKSHGKLFYSRRGERLKHEDGSLGRIQDPLEAAVNASRAVSRRTAMNDFITDLKTRYVNEFGDITHNEFSKPVRELVKDVSSGRQAKGEAMYNYIRQLEGQVGLNFDAQLHLIKLADNLESWKIPVLPQAARWASDKADPISFVRARNFEFNLGTDPVRQLILQPSQTLFTAALDPGNYIKNVNVGRVVTRLSKDDLSKVSDADLDKIAKTNVLGIDGKELRSLIEEFRQTGLGQAVTSHQIARDSAKPLDVAASGNKFEQAASKAASLYTTPVSILRQGFERGEEINLGTHWMLSRARWAKNNPDKNPADHILEVAGEARGLALSMTQAGDFAYQRGVLSVPLQYFSIRHKGLLALTTNKHFTKPEKARLAVAQLAMWGPEGLALGGVMAWAREQYGAELPEFFRDGLVETFINNAFSLATNEDTDIDFSGTFSLLKGVDKDNFVRGVWDLVRGEGQFADLAFGATKSNMNRIERFWDTAGVLVNTDIGNTNFDDIAGLTADDFGKILSSYNRMAQGLAMLRSGSWLDSKGQEIMPASIAESIMFGVMGLSSNKVEAMYELQRAIDPPSKQRKTDLEDTVDVYYRVALQLTNKALEDYERGASLSSVWAQHKAMMATNNLIIASMGPEADVVMNKVKAKIDRNTSGQQVDELLDKLGKLYMTKDNANLITIAEEEGLVDAEHAAKLQDIYNFMWDFE